MFFVKTAADNSIRLTSELDQFIMRMRNQIICEQIDITLIGSRSFELLEILLSQNLNLVPLPKVKNKYLSKLWSLYPAQPDPSLKLSSKFPKQMADKKIQKYSTNLMTESFWVQFNFFYFGALSYDPILADITRGHIPICILVSNEEEKDKLQMKKLLSNEGVNMPARQMIIEPSRMNFNREELIMEQKIIGAMHSFKLNDFPSVLALKMIDKNRIIQSSSNIKLSRNQILRWIVQQYFENQFSIKLKGELGDQIQNYKSMQKDSYCTIM